MAVQHQNQQQRLAVLQLQQKLAASWKAGLQPPPPRSTPADRDSRRWLRQTQLQQPGQHQMRVLSCWVQQLLHFWRRCWRGRLL